MQEKNGYIKECSNSRASKDTRLYWACMFYMEHNKRSEEQETKFISDMVGSSKSLWFSSSSLNAKNNGKFLVPWRTKEHFNAVLQPFLHAIFNRQIYHGVAKIRSRYCHRMYYFKILFVLVMEMILPSTEEATLMTPSLKAFMDDIVVLTKTVHSAKD